MSDDEDALDPRQDPPADPEPDGGPPPTADGANGSEPADEADRSDAAGDDADRPGTDEPETDEGGSDASDSHEVGGEDLEAHTTARRSVSPRVQIVWGVRMLVGAMVLTFVASFVSMTVTSIPSWAGAAVGVALLALGVIWVHLRYRVWAYEVRADALYLERGVLTHVRTVAPYVRIQHVDTQRGPLERWLGLSTLVVYTAGTRGADVSIPGLTPTEARDLQGRVKELAIHAEGGDAV